MKDLETLLRDRQDELRGRPEDGIDRFMAWHRSVDWRTVAYTVYLTFGFVGLVIILFHRHG